MPMDPATQASLAGAVFLVLLSGLFSGLNLGLMSFTDDDLGLVISGSSDPHEIECAKRIRPIRANGNLLLCTLLLGNTLVNAVIAILLSDLTSGIVGAIVTTALILVFGEIIPQSVCSRHALAVGSAVLPIVQMFVFVCYPIAYPISLLLDRLLGREVSGVFSRQGLLALVKLNVESEPHAADSDLTAADMRVIKGALTYQDQTVQDVMASLKSVFALPLDTELNKDAVLSILSNGHTRIPIYSGDRTNVVALLFAKDLLGIGFEHRLPLSRVLESFDAYNRVHWVKPDLKLNEALQMCQRLHAHMLVVGADAGPPGSRAASGLEPSVAEGTGALGIVTMEDFIEQILQENIVDEHDLYVPINKQMTQKWEATAAVATSQAKAAAPAPSAGLQSRLMAKVRTAPALARLNSKAYDTTALLRSLPVAPDHTSPQSQARAPATAAASMASVAKWLTPRLSTSSPPKTTQVNEAGMKEIL